MVYLFNNYYLFLGITEALLDDFATEAKIAANFQHENLMSIIGISHAINEPPLIVMPPMVNGDLLSYIRLHEKNIALRTKLNFIRQIAQGMVFLAEKSFVHRDLAARNCLLDGNLTLKVSDFGLSRHMYDAVYVKENNMTIMLPVKWMAPESFDKNRFNEASDVWSFGVTCWEIVTNGRVPYAAMSKDEVCEYVRNKRTLSRPRKCNRSLFQFIQECWTFDPEQRPTFAILLETLNSEENGFNQIRFNFC